ncbi:hypothetical protein [Nitrosococcus wardiae]|uniref:Uncharacterized protein n=1 Tax=Nitrosococcus wardiae TaxID=1814290 RepID=A0A4V1AW07_9GAMM|nr:hypothetical protein [Nitrosococcus wardiae]QBQ54975.1 hypothetical protein E3U44_10955 [Nitrosococcus wardiae]
MNNESKFRKAMDEHLTLVEKLGDDHPEAMWAMWRVMELAPQELQDSMMAKAKAVGLIPEKPDGYFDNKPVYRLENIAKRLGMTPQEAEVAIYQMIAERQAAGLPVDELVMDAERIEKVH